MNKNKKLSEYSKWKKYLLDEINFYKISKPKLLKNKFIGHTYAFFLKLYIRELTIYYLRKIGILKFIYSLSNKNSTELWFKENSSKLWDFRKQLVDKESIFNFDSVLILRSTSAFQYFFRKPFNRDYIDLKSEKIFNEKFYPKRYINIPLIVAKASFYENKDVFQIIAPESFINYMNEFQQYFPLISNKRFLPNKGDIVIDCGSCIGDVSVLLAQMVGSKGKVFMLDPSNLHNKFAELQIKYNPHLRNVLIPCKYAVTDKSKLAQKNIDDGKEINPGSIDITSFNTICLDDFCKINNIDKLGYIKMDIEGYEFEALKGGKAIINKYKPKLAISAYHKRDDFWNISNLIKEILPEYELFFRHHSPIRGESVIYAMTREELENS